MGLTMPLGSGTPAAPSQRQSLPPDGPLPITVLACPPARRASVATSSFRACAGASPRLITAERLSFVSSEAAGRTLDLVVARFAHSRRCPGELDVLATPARKTCDPQRNAPPHDRSFDDGAPSFGRTPSRRRFGPARPGSLCICRIGAGS